MKAWLSFLDNVCKLLVKQEKKNQFFSLDVLCFADVRLVLFFILFIECRTISGLTTTATSEIVPSSNNVNCTDVFNNTNHKIDYVHGDVVISVISINPLPSQFILNRVSDSIDSKLSLGKFINGFAIKFS